MAIELELAPEEEMAEKDWDAMRLKTAGCYHFVVTGADEEPVWRGGASKGQPRNGFLVEAEVVAGPMKGKTQEFLVRTPSAEDKDGGKFGRVVRAKFLEAISVVNPADRGKTVVIELVKGDDCVIAGRQFIAKLKANDKGYLDLEGRHIWHVDDPAADQCERDQKAIGMIPAKFRRKPESFEKVDQGAGSNGNGNGHTAAAPPASKINVDDI